MTKQSQEKHQTDQEIVGNANIDRLISSRIVGSFQELLPEFAARLGAAVGTWLHNKAIIAIARDFRADSRMMKRAFTAGLMSSGVAAIDFHAVPTPLLQFYIRRFGANAGVMFTGGHYEGEKTGIRIFDETGAELTREKLGEIRSILQSGQVRRVKPSEIADISEATGAIDVYLAAINNLVSRKLISEKRFKIVVDCALGPTSLVIPELLSRMNVEVIAINAFNPKRVPRNLPNPQSLQSLARTVKANQADFGVTFDVEGSRVVICDENGTIRTTDTLTLGLANQALQKSNKGKLIVSESTTKSIDVLVEAYGTHKVVRVKDDPGKIAAAIRLEQGIFGASDTGSYWAPSFTVDSDGIYTTLKLLELLATNETTLSEYLQTLPQFPAVHRELILREGSHAEHLYTHLDRHEKWAEDLHFKYSVDTLAGTKVVFQEGWVSVMPSSHDENAVHLICETTNFTTANKLLDAVQAEILHYTNHAKNKKEC